MKKLLSLLSALALAGAMTVSACAIDIDLDDYYSLSDGDLTPQGLLTDNANILSSSEEERIEEALSDVSDKYDIDVIVYTTRDVAFDSESECANFANERFDEYLYEYDVNDAVFFVVDMDYRLWYIATESKGKEAISDSYGIELFEEKLVDYLRDGDYEECFLEYAELCEKFFEAYDKGNPYSATHPFVTAGMIIKSVLIGAIFGLILALVVTSSLKRQLRSVDNQRTANNFVRRGSFNLQTTKDLFLYKNVTKTRRQSSSSGGRSGGSRGGSRGGGGGRF